MQESDEKQWAADALGVDPAVLEDFGREPLGSGAVAGFSGPDGLLVYVDSSGLAVPAEAVRSGQVRVWQHPADPHIPALGPIAYPDGAAALLGRLGLGPLEEIEMAAYRPGRRAVLRARAGGRTVWLKAVRPSRTEHIVAAHRALEAASVPVPKVLGWSPEGLIVISAAEGVALTEAEQDAGAVLDAVEGLRAQLAGVALDQPARASLLSRRDWYAERLRLAVPETPLVDAVVEAVARTVDPEPGEHVTIHGDLHAGQLFISADGDRIEGLIDVDTAGRGPAVEDSAAFVGHALASALASPPGAGADRMRAFAAEGHRRWGSDPGMRTRLQVHLMGHALTASHLDRERALALLEVAAVASSPDATGDALQRI